MIKDVTTLVYRGELHYARVLGDPVPNYAGDGYEWRFDFIPNDQKSAMAELRKLGVGDRLRTKENNDGTLRYDGRPFMSFRHRATKADGSPAQPLKVLDIMGNPWNPEQLLGNGTVADVKFIIVDNGKGRFAGVYPRAIRVLDLVPYFKDEFDPLPEDDDFVKKAKDIEMLAGKPAQSKTRGKAVLEEGELDDELPFGDD